MITVPTLLQLAKGGSPTSGVSDPHDRPVGDVMCRSGMSQNPFAPLRRPQVRRLWLAAVMSDVGTWVQLIVVGVLVASSTGSALRTGLVAVATFMPQGIAAPIGGLLADRFDKRRVLASALVLQGTVTAVLALTLAAGVRDPAVLTLLVLFSAMAGALGQPSYAAMLPDLVPAEELVAMLSLGIYAWNGGRIIGPLLATALAAAVGPAWTVAFNAMTFLVMAFVVSMVRQEFPPHAADPMSIGQRLVMGWRVTRSTPACWLGIVLVVHFSVTVVGFIGLVPIYARSLFDGGTGVTGALASAQGVGAIIGGVFVTWLAVRHRRSSLLLGIFAGVPVAMLVYALAPSVPVAILGIFLLGSVSAPYFITTSAIIQRNAPAASRGRVMSISQASSGLSYGTGLIFLGVLADLTDIRTALMIGVGLMAAGVIWLLRRVPGWRGIVDTSAADATPTPVT